MSSTKGSADQTRRHGFKETKEQYELRRKQEKQLKWDEKLSRESLDKLNKELDSLERATFLAPQQNERKRLVVRMVRDLEARAKPVTEAEPVAAKESSPPPDSDSDDDFLFSSSAITRDEDKQLFVPRKLRRKEEPVVAEAPKTAQQTAEDAERELLEAGDAEENLDAFLDSLE